MEHRKGGSEIEFLKDDIQYANKVDLAFDRLFEGAQSDSEYLDNVSLAWVWPESYTTFIL